MKKKLFLIMLVFLFNYLFAQDTTKTKEKRKSNAIKGIIASNPFTFPYGMLVFSIGYERYITANSSINLNLNFFGRGGEGEGSIISKLLCYNYYFSSKYKFINNIWLSAYIINSNEFYGSDIYTKSNILGAGLSTGKRLFFSYKKRLFFDLGFGMSYNRTNYIYKRYYVWDPSIMSYVFAYTELPKPYYSFFPRTILLLGYKF